MRQAFEAVLLRIFIGERAEHRGQPLHAAIVTAAREAGLAGATVLRGVLGYGHAGRTAAASLDASDDVPLVVEIVDAAARIEAFLPALDELMTCGLVTLETARVIRYGAGGGETFHDFAERAMQAEARVEHGLHEPPHAG